MTTLGGIPQIIKMARTKKTEDVSWGMLGCWMVGLTMTCIYGVSVGQPPVYVSATASILMTLAMAGIKHHCEHIKYDAISYSQVEIGTV